MMYFPLFPKHLDEDSSGLPVALDKNTKKRFVMETLVREGKAFGRITSRAATPHHHKSPFLQLLNFLRIPRRPVHLCLGKGSEDLLLEVRRIRRTRVSALVLLRDEMR